MGWHVELLSEGSPIGWLGEAGGEWCVVVSRGGAVELEFYDWKDVRYIRKTGDTSRYLSVSDGDHYVGFYNWLNARGWWLDEYTLTSLYTNASLSYRPGGESWVYANAGSGYAPLEVRLHDVGPEKITNVFVLMLENHSFDNVFALSGIPGIEAATTSDCNTYTFDGSTKTYCVQGSAPTSMPTDPGHEFLDAVEQLAGQGYPWRSGQEYPPVTNSGYVANYATSRTEIAGAKRLPTPSEYPLVMKCFDTQRQLPVIYQLATEFAVCDHWYSSLPGPTWPNRFFVHGASSANWDDSPTSSQIAQWELTPGGGFVYPHGSIYDLLRRNGIDFRIYADRSGPALGSIPQVAALKGIAQLSVYDFARFKNDLQGPYPAKYTFIEPNYGDVGGGNYQGGSSQHPMDGMERGEALIKQTYEALRASPLWPTSVLIITYDEHGGFYDSGHPPQTATPPGDGGPVPANQHGFTFRQYGVRVPAVVVSPRIRRGTVDHTTYDHSSVPATLERLWGMPPLTNRDRSAADVLHLLSLDVPRDDCPQRLADPAPDDRVRAPLTDEDRAAIAAQPLPESGNVVGWLATVHLGDLELSEGDEAEIAAKRARYEAITTRGEAEAYATEVHAKLEAARAPLP